MALLGLTRKQTLMLVVMIFGTFIAVLNQTLVTPALPSIMIETSVDASTAQWLTTGFTLVNAIMIPITAFLIDRFSMRNLFLVAMAIFTAGSAIAGWGPNFPTILAGRLVQAAGEGVMMPLVMTELMLMFPVEKRGTAMGLYGLVIGFAPALGPTAAGLIIDNATWHDLFFTVAGLGVVILVFSAVVLEHGQGARKDATLDVLSVITSTLGFGGLLYGLSVIGGSGVSAAALIGVIVGVVALAVFFTRQLKMDKPMLQVRVLANRKFLISTIISMVVQGALMAAGILYPFLLACAVSVVLIFACIVVSRYMNITLAFRWSLPLFVLSYLPLMVDYDSQVLRMLGYALNFLGMFGVQYGCWLGIAKRAHRARTSIVPYMAALCAAEGAGVVAGCLIAFQVVHNPFTDILCVSFALLFVATATSMVGGFNPEWIFIRSPKNLRPAGGDDACAKAACSESPSCEAGQPPQARDEKVDDAPAELDRLFRQQALALQPCFALTDRETEVAGLLLAGRSRPYIRDTLFISLNTVGVHVRNIFSKCGVHSQQELIDLARQER